VKDGFGALQRGEWGEAETHFRAALAGRETPEAWEGLGMALWWLTDLDNAFDARERAYRLYRARGSARGAGRLAIWLAWDYLGARGQPAVARGWLQRAHSLLDGLELCSEQAWLALREAEDAIIWGDDPATACHFAARGVEIARSLGLLDLEMYGMAIEGFALVSEGKIRDGMRRLDEATAAAVSGEMISRTAIGSTCCCLIFACERVFDYDRAVQWVDRLQEYCKRIGYVPMLGVCRTHHAGVLVWSGAWDEAETELAEASLTVRATRPAYLVETMSRLGSLRYRQGRLDEARALFEQSLPFPPAQLGLGWLALDLGEAQTALDYTERYLRRIPRENHTERVRGLELLSRAYIALGDMDRAQAALEDLAKIAREIGAGPVRAVAVSASGAVAAAAGDHERARSHLEDAVDLFARSGAPFEMGQARIALAASLEALGRLPAAEREALAAMTGLGELGARREEARAERLLQHIRKALKSRPEQADKSRVLSPREKEVLRLVAQGLGDQEIAERLMLSRHTVHRHVTNILARLEVRSRAAATAYAMQEGLL
jgi:DNA-binding NarL/FixJ family response regulator